MDGWNFLSSLHPYQDVSFHPQSGKNVTACEEMSPALGFPSRGAEVRLLTHDLKRAMPLETGTPGLPI